MIYDYPRRSCAEYLGAGGRMDGKKRKEREKEKREKFERIDKSYHVVGIELRSLHMSDKSMHCDV